MCLNVKEITKNGQYKETTYKGKKGENYSITSWAKCGHCIECIAEKANNWVIRNTYESKEHKQKCFITLTYKKNPYILIKKDLQDFFKRLRKQLEKENIQIRYFACGEYGTKNGRPHYHAIIYGWEDQKPIYKGINKKGNIITESTIIKKTWGKGLTSYQKFNEFEIPYISLYNSPNNTHKQKYIASKNKLKNIYKHNKSALKNLINQMEKIKGNFMEIKEFNVWSKGLGWNEWLKNYDTISQTMTEYINDKEFLTPTPWLKKLAENGETLAIQELNQRKNYEIKRKETETERKDLKKQKYQKTLNKDIIKWHKEKEKTEDF